MDIEQLKRLAPHGHLDWMQAIIDEAPRWEINNPARQALFIGQYFVETAGFTVFEENLNYSAKGLMATWPRLFTTLEMAQQYERQPEKIANFVYANRMGNNSLGDGWLYRGRGLPQLTGHANYKSCGIAISAQLEEFPELLLRPEIGVRAGCWYWYSHGCNELADKKDIPGVTRAINGGQIGLTERQSKSIEALSLFQP